MTVAVLTTCFNQEAFVEQTIQSVFTQTYPAAQHIVVDDGSTDTSADVLDRYPHLRRMKVTNRGMTNARNAGLLALDQEIEWVIPVDGDDWLAPNFVEACLGVAHAEPDAGVVFSKCVRHRGEQRSEPTFPKVLHPTEEQMWERCYAHSCAMIRRDVLVEAGGWHGMMLGDHDWDFWIDCLRRGIRFAYAADTFYNYRIHTDSYTQTVAEQLLPGHLAEMRRHHLCSAP